MRAIKEALYFFASGRSASIRSGLAEMELMRGLVLHGLEPRLHGLHVARVEGEGDVRHLLHRLNHPLHETGAHLAGRSQIDVE